VRLLLDTHVVLDVLLNREPHAEAAASLFALVERGAVRGVLGATTVTTVHYLAEKHVGKVPAREHIRTLLLLFDVANVSKATLIQALESELEDYEDAVLHQAGIDAEVDGIVTRNRDDFLKSEAPVFSPSEALAALEAPEATE
jgi:predicted nucleic acid-binding protein